MKVKIKKVSVPYFSALIKKMLLMDTSLYINLNKERVWSSVYIPTKDVVKSFGLPVDDVFEFENQPEETIKLSFFSGVRLLNCIGYFDPHHLSMEISTYRDDEDGVLYGDKIKLSDQKLKIDIHCQDISLGFTSMTDEQTGRAFDESTAMFNFTLSREDMTKITQLMALDKSELFQIVQDADGVHIKTDAFDIVVDDRSKSEDLITKSTFKNFLDRIDKETYSVSVCDSKIILKSQETATMAALNLAITE